MKLQILFEELNELLKAKNEKITFLEWQLKEAKKEIEELRKGQ